MKKILFSGVTNTLRTDMGLSLLRIFTGLSLALAHGMGKVPPSTGFIEHTADLGFPLPALFGWLAGFSEFFGALFLAFGLFTRPAAIMVAATMFVAGFINHSADPYGSAEKAYLYFAIAILFLILGSGRYSLDNIIRKRLKLY
jgi:putative oxidoreductase